jgi:WXG100 family type VII secretion target
MAEIRVTIPGLQDLSRSVQKNNEDLRRLTADVERTVGSTVWTGQAAEKFKESWAQQKKSLQTMSDMLDQVKKEVEERTRRLESFEA